MPTHITHPINKKDEVERKKYVKIISCHTIIDSFASTNIEFIGSSITCFVVIIMIFRKGDAIMQCVETSLMKCEDPTPSNLVHGLLKAMKDGTPCARAAEGWHSGYSETQTRTQLLLAVFAIASVNLSL